MRLLGSVQDVSVSMCAADHLPLDRRCSTVQRLTISLLPAASLCLATVWVVSTPWLLAQLPSVLRLVAGHPPRSVDVRSC